MKVLTVAKYETLSDLQSWVAIIFLILFPVVFTGTIVLLLPKGDQSRLIFLVVGTMNTYMLMYAGMNATLTLIERRQSGVLRRIFILPISKLEFLIGKSLGVLAQVSVQVVIMVAMLLMFGLQMNGSWLSFFVVMLLLMLLAITLGILVALGVGSAINFDALFLRFHFLAFTNDLWQLDPTRDYLIMLFPEGFWFDAGILLGVATTAIAGTLLGVSLGYLRRQRKPA